MTHAELRMRHVTDLLNVGSHFLHECSCLLRIRSCWKYYFFYRTLLLGTLPSVALGTITSPDPGPFTIRRYKYGYIVLLPDFHPVCLHNQGLILNRHFLFFFFPIFILIPKSNRCVLKFSGSFFLFFFSSLLWEGETEYI